MNKLSLPLIYSIILIALGSFPALAREKPSEPPGQTQKEQKATIGNVEKVSGNSVTVGQKTPPSTEAEVGKNTKIVGQDNKPLKLKSLKPKDLVAVISTDSATGSANRKKAIKIFVKEASDAASKRKAIQGVIINIEGQLITLAHQIQRDRKFSVLVNSLTIIKAKGASESATLTNLSVGQRIVAVGDQDDGGILVAKMIHVIPGRATGIFKRLPVATPSATLGSTPSGSAIATVSATPTATSTPSLSPTP